MANTPPLDPTTPTQLACVSEILPCPETVVATTTYPNLKWSTYSKHPINIPPLEEQKRIVAKLDALFEKIDSSIEKLNNDIQHINELIQSHLDRIFDVIEDTPIYILLRKLWTKQADRTNYANCQFGVW